MPPTSGRMASTASSNSALSSTIQRDHHHQYSNHTTPTTSEAAEKQQASRRFGSQHQLQALQQVVPTAWASDNPHGITDFLLADDDDDDASSMKPQRKLRKTRAKKNLPPTDVLQLSPAPSSSLSPSSSSGPLAMPPPPPARSPILSSSVPRSMRLVSYSHSSPSVTTSASRASDMLNNSSLMGTAPRSSAASSVRSSVMSITQNPDDELTAASNHDDLDDVPYEYEGDGDGEEGDEDVDYDYDEEAAESRLSAGRTTENSQRRTFGDGGGGGNDEVDSDLGEIDVDLDEDVVWEEIRRRVGELRTAYQHILHHGAAITSSPAASHGL